jgi:hypothetical protein
LAARGCIMCCGGAVSDGHWELLTQQRQAFEPLCEVPPPQHLRLHTTRPLALAAEKAMRQLTSRAPLLGPSEGKGRGEDLRCLQ